VWFPEWETFYIVLGTAAGALTGLIFVVSALIGNIPDATEETVHAYATPTVVHLGNVLLLSLVFVAPWPSVLLLNLTVGVFGSCGTVYMLLVWRRAIRQTGYTPVFEDWFWYTAMPLAGYVAIVAAAVALHWRTSVSLFLIGGSGVVLLFTGIRNSWDNLVYISVGRRTK
jgi:hypothetical protein